MRVTRWSVALVVALALAWRLEAQPAPTVIFTYDTPPLPPAATVQGWIATLYVNGSPFVVNDVCVLTTTITPNVITCTAPLPAIQTALTTSGAQTFEVTLTDVILESLRSLPFVLARPSAPKTARIQ